MSAHLGKDCILWRVDNGTGLTEMMRNVRDVSLNMDAGEVDVTTRGSNDWRKFLQGLKEAQLEFEMLVDSSDADYTAIRTAYILGYRTHFWVCDNNDEWGYHFEGEVTGFGNDQPLEEGDSVNVTVRAMTAVSYTTVDH